MLEVRNITINLKNFLLPPISFSIEDGKSLSIMGPSGTGKTTLLKILLGFLIPDTGKIILDNEDITHLKPQKRKMSIVTQDPLLFPHLKVEKNVAFGIVPHIKDKTKRAKDIMELVRISHLAKRSPKTLSGGEKQRVALARALFVNPKILLLDEPFSSLDEELKITLRDEVLNLQKKLGFTIILVTHNKEEAYYMGDSVMFMSEIGQKPDQ